MVPVDSTRGGVMTRGHRRRRRRGGWRRGATRCPGTTPCSRAPVAGGRPRPRRRPGQPAGRCSVRRPVRVRDAAAVSSAGRAPDGSCGGGTRSRGGAAGAEPPWSTRPWPVGAVRSCGGRGTRPRSSYARGRMGGAQTQSPAGRAPGARPPAAAPGRTRRLPAGRSGPAGRRARARLGPRTGPEEPSGGATAPRRQGPARRPILSRSDEIPAPPRSDPGRC